jgi:Response regulator containing a CheY-like receiver domain and a GGDEF domain
VTANDNENTPNQVKRDNLESKTEFLDAVRRHICQILAFDYGFIDMASGHEITNLATFSVDDEDDVANEFVESLVDEHKQPITGANTLGAQKVKQTQRAWIGKAYTPEDLEGVTDASEIEADGFPYAIVPVMDNPMGGTGQVNGLIRVISFDPSRAITTQDVTTLKLMGEHLASRTGLFGTTSVSPDDDNEASGEHGDLDTVLIVHTNRPVRRRFSRILIKMYKVLEAESSEKALELLESNRVDVILLDGEMQGASGFAFCKVLKIASNGNTFQLFCWCRTISPPREWKD